MGVSSKVQMDEMMLRMAVISALCVAYSIAAAPAPAPAPQLDCSSQLNALLPCLDYVKTTGKDVPPSDCCTSLSSVVKNYPSCLCQLLNSPAAVSIGVNTTTALALPAKCRISGANISECPGAHQLGPVPSPVTGGTTPSSGSGSSTPTPGSPSSSAFVSIPTNMGYLAFVAACLLFLIN